jgi:hypothetical protein
LSEAESMLCPAQMLGDALPIDKSSAAFAPPRAKPPPAFCRFYLLTLNSGPYPMTRRTIEIIAFFIALLLAGLALSAWLQSRGEQQRLQSTLDSQKKLLAAADARENNRNSTLTDVLAQINALKNNVQTPGEIVRDLPKYLPLPQPITLNAPTATSAPVTAAPGKKSGQGTSPSAQKGTAAKNPPSATPQSPASDAVPIAVAAENSLPKAPAAAPSTAPGCDPTAACDAQIPAADLKPLYDYVQDCRACQAELTVAKQNAADDAAKLAALTKERDAAITASKGGTFWRRLRRNALWFAVGAATGSAAGYVAAKR